jgi:hypothetical protein
LAACATPAVSINAAVTIMTTAVFLFFALIFAAPLSCFLTLLQMRALRISPSGNGHPRSKA